MNRDYLKLVNITLYKEVISKNISSAVPQFVLVALARAEMVFMSKALLEMISTSREHIKKQKEHSAKQRNKICKKKKLIVMQQSTDKQLDDRVAGKHDQTVQRTVRTILSTDFPTNAFKYMALFLMK